MNADYEAWIVAHVPENSAGRCAEITQEMVAAFPELTRVRGHFNDAVWGRRAHWWLVDRDGSIVDPTAAQFPCKGVGFYEPWPEGTEEPTGKCLNCGEYAYGHQTFCSKICEIETTAEMNAIIQR